MKKTKMLIICLVFLFLAPLILTAAARAGEKSYQEYIVSNEKFKEHKNFFDDPRPLMDGLNYKKILPPEIYAKLIFDVERMKSLWAEVVGFKAPDLVGKIAPEIKPGNYTYKDKEKYPGFKELMPPDLYNRFNPGGPPHVGNFPEIEIVPTSQYYWALPIAEATKKYMGQTKQDADGYLDYSSYVTGYPFPQPSGKFKAQQIIYNWEKRYLHADQVFHLTQTRGFNKELKIDFEGFTDTLMAKLEARLLMPPYGWFDERAQKEGETRTMAMVHLAPRDMYGSALTNISYIAPKHLDQFLLYISSMRRIRKMSSSDTQDAVGGQDNIYEDIDGFQGKLDRYIYPYKFELMAEREYLVEAPSLDGSVYLSSKGMEFRNVKLERRPLYVVELTQLDKHHVYSKRILYFDKETFNLYHIDNFDQKGRLYRTTDMPTIFVSEMGNFFVTYFFTRDHIDLHSFLGLIYETPIWKLTREDIGMQSMLNRVK